MKRVAVQILVFIFFVPIILELITTVVKNYDVTSYNNRWYYLIGYIERFILYLGFYLYATLFKLCKYTRLACISVLVSSFYYILVVVFQIPLKYVGFTTTLMLSTSAILFIISFLNNKVNGQLLHNSCIRRIINILHNDRV